MKRMGLGYEIKQTIFDNFGFNFYFSILQLFKHTYNDYTEKRIYSFARIKGERISKRISC